MVTLHVISRKCDQGLSSHAGQSESHSWLIWRLPGVLHGFLGTGSRFFSDGVAATGYQASWAGLLSLNGRKYIGLIIDQSF